MGRAGLDVEGDPDGMVIRPGKSLFRHPSIPTGTTGGHVLRGVGPLLRRVSEIRNPSR